jgi:DNA processing protein
MLLLTDDVKIQRLALFSAIEAGNSYWARQVAEFGIAMVYEHLALGLYDATKFGAISQAINTFNADESLAAIAQSGGVFITPEDLGWPMRVNQLTIPPLGLIVKGDISILNNPSLAIVGTRNPTPYGVRLAGDFASGFVDRQWDIISGGAYGIDTAAHRGALVAEGRTIAVIASGIDVQYPAGNARLFDEICESGAIVSEVMPGVTAMPHRFLIRNRLIAALSLSTLVVEAAFRSGSLRTARDAAELLRPVMAIPGPISSPSSEGCHRLIGERAAELVTSVADAMELISAL